MKTDIFKKYNSSLSNIANDWMNTNEIADIMYYILNLPKQIEISEITISRKPNYKWYNFINHKFKIQYKNKGKDYKWKKTMVEMKI